MSAHNLSQAQFWFEIGGRSADTFQLLEFYGNEAISQPYRFELSLASPVDNDLDLADLLNQPAKLIMLREEEKKEIYGILSELEEIGRNKEFAFFHAVFVPRLWRLSLYYQSRVFQNKSVPDIIKDVLKAAGLKPDDYRLDLNSSYQPREYCVQYRETDLNFISRLMEYEGISFFFDQKDGKDLLVVVDENRKYPKIESPDEIESFAGEGMTPQETEIVHELAWHEKVVTGKVVLKDYNYRTPETSLSAESQLDQKSPGVYYDYGDHFKTAAQGKTLAKIRNEEIESVRRTVTGGSTCRGFHAGHAFRLAKHYRNALNGNYLLTQVSHYASQAGGSAATDNGGASTPAYRNEFTCIPADVQYRPTRLTPEPRIPGIMTARVESTGGEYAHLDEEGRYRVKMPFDLSDPGQGKASRAIRLAQPYTGSGYGMHFPVHAGTELVWACIDGNVDRPLGLSSVSNPTQSTPVSAQNKSQNVIRSASGNQLVMDDMKGETQIELRTADGHWLLLDDKDDSVEIHTTKNHMIRLDDKNQQIYVQTTDGHAFLMDDMNKQIRVQSKNGHHIVIDDDGGSITISDKDEKNKLVIDISNNKITIETQEGSIDMSAPEGEIRLKAKKLLIDTEVETLIKSKDIGLTASGKYNLKATGKITQETEGDFSQKGMNVKSEATAEHKISGLNVSSEATVQQEVKGTMVTVQATAVNTVKGAVVMIN